MHEAHRERGELIMRGGATKRVELAVGAQEHDVVIHLGGFLETSRQFVEPRALFSRCTARRTARDETLDLASHFEQPQLFFQIDFGNDNATPWKYRHETFTREPLQRLADGRATDTQRLRKCDLGDHRAWQ